MKRLLSLFLLACGSGHKMLSVPESSFGEDVYGYLEDVPIKGYDVSVARPEPQSSLSGELLAVTETELYLLKSDRMLTIEGSDIESVKLTINRGDWLVPVVILWSVSGFVGTLSHGALLVFSAPTWAIVGTSDSLVAALYDNSRYVGQKDIAGLRRFARFPQGLPPNWAPINRD